jgi:hypothetical protein
MRLSRQATVPMLVVPAGIIVAFLFLRIDYIISHLGTVQIALLVAAILSLVRVFVRPASRTELGISIVLALAAATILLVVTNYAADPLRVTGMLR